MSVEDVIKAIKSAFSKQCATDPLPTWLLKDSIAVLAPYITSLFNTSLTNGYFPTQWNNAIVKLLIKKRKLDWTNHLNRHNLLPDVQSAYNKGFSTETAVLKVYSDIIDAISNEKNGSSVPP